MKSKKRTLLTNSVVLAAYVACDMDHKYVGYVL
jgi:hypothetical protein